MTLIELFQWHCQEGDRWHRLAEEEKSTGTRLAKESIRRTYARKAQHHRDAAQCIHDVVSRS